MDTITEQATGTLTSTLAVEVVDALYPQWCVNGHNIPAAVETVAEKHADPKIREKAATVPLVEALVSTFTAEFWVRARRERAMLAG